MGAVAKFYVSPGALPVLLLALGVHVFMAWSALRRTSSEPIRWAVLISGVAVMALLRDGLHVVSYGAALGLYWAADTRRLSAWAYAVAAAVAVGWAAVAGLGLAFALSV